MNRLGFILLCTTFLIGSCTKVGNYYAEYKKYLGLDKNDTYLLSGTRPVSFKNEDLKVEFQNFDAENKGNLVKVKKIEPIKEERISAKEIKTELKEQFLDPEFGASLALFNVDRGKFKGEVDVERVPASVGTYYENPYYKAQALIKKGKFKDAEYNLNIYLKDNTAEAEHSYSSYFWLAELNLVKKDYITAIANYNEILDKKFVNVNYELIYFKLYESYSNMGRKDLAKRFFLKIKEVNPVSTYLKVLK